MTVKLNLRPLDRLVDKVVNGKGPMRDVYTQWAARYRAFARARFVKLGRGGGDWAPLAESTKRQRRKARRGYKGSRKFTILRDTDTLFNALHPQLENPGALKKHLRDGIRVGYGGSARHPKGKMTIARLAEIHHRGLGHNPARPIIVEPDRATLNRMKKDYERGLRKLATWVR